MRVIDFLALIQTLNKQTLFYFETNAHQFIPVTDYVSDKNNHLILQTVKGQKPRKQWELFILLQKKELLNQLLYIQEAGQQPRPIFGFRLESRRALLG